MSDGLYNEDILIWSERQAGLLRRLAAGEQVNEAVDWANVIEEVESVGRSEWHACESLLLQALVHLLKMHVWPAGDAVGHWRTETVAFLGTARRQFSPSMRQPIDLEDLYRDALYAVGQVADMSRPAPTACPYSLDELLDKRPDISALLAKLAA